MVKLLAEVLLPLDHKSFWSPWVSRVDKWYMVDRWHAIRTVVRRIDWNMLKCQHLLVQPRAVTPSGNTATGFGDCCCYTDWEKPSQKAGWREAQPLLLSTSEIFRPSLGMSTVWRNTEWCRTAPGLVGHCPPNICHPWWDLASPCADVPSEVFLRIRGGMTAVFGPWGALCWGHCQGQQRGSAPKTWQDQSWALSTRSETSPWLGLYPQPPQVKPFGGSGQVNLYWKPTALTSSALIILLICSFYIMGNIHLFTFSCPHTN